MDPLQQPESTFTFITRVTKQSNGGCLQLPVVEHSQQRKSPSNRFLVRHKELTRKRQRNMNLHSSSLKYP